MIRIDDPNNMRRSGVHDSQSTVLECKETSKGMPDTLGRYLALAGDL